MNRPLPATSDPVSGTHRLFNMSSLPPTRIIKASPARHVSFAAVGECLSMVDELGAAATGALVFGEPTSSTGAILVEKGKICWAVANGFTRRLTDLLRHQSEPALPKERIEEVVAQCRGDGRPLGEALVLAGLVSDQGLRNALKEQTTEAVAMIAACGVPGRFLPHRNATYDPRYAFSTTEILAKVGAIQSEADSLSARAKLRAVVGSMARGAVFSRTRGQALLVGVEEDGGASFTAEQLMQISSWALGQLDVASAVATGLRLVSSAGEDGHSIVAWKEEDLVFVAVCESPQALARVLMGASRK